ncbi:MAG: FtsX-like permease family protein [Spirochaetaceae bacterium]|jgi:ABC-type lipoprotein release transport system permease subunit|nr:FtsX-like permease family protein [Spirochaetaceae bacterium]
MTISRVIELKRLALRNLARHKVKTILTCAAIMVSVTVYIWMDSWIGGMFLESRRNIINYEIGAAKIQTKRYFDKKDELPGYETFGGWKDYAEVLDEAGYDAAPRYAFSGTLYSLTGSAPLVIYACDPAAEARTLAYPSYIELGRYIRDDEFGIALGLMTADKLKAGVPTRPEPAELEELIAAVRAAGGFGPGDETFIRSCYAPMEAKVQFGETRGYAEERAKSRLVLKRGLSRPELDRLWALADATGRNDLRISTVIDYKLAPDSIRQDKWDADLWPLLGTEEQALVAAAYEYDDLTGAYLLSEEDPAKLDAALAAMLRVDFSGAIRHVNQVIDVKVVGLVNSPDPVNNYNIGYMPLDVLQDEAGMMLEGRITELLIRDKSLGAADMTSPIETKAAIRAALDAGLAKRGLALPAELDVFFWMDYMKDYLGYEAMESGSTMIFSVLLFLLAFIGISNTMLLAILERTKEIGMMRALGMTSGQLIFTYMVEACLLGLIGSVLGIIAGCLLNIPMVKYGVDFSEMMEQMGGNMGYRVAGNFRGTWRIGTIIGSGVVATFLSSLMALLPARRATKMEITESLRFE